MWRRWNNNHRDPQIGEPMLYETTLDEGYLETIPEVESIISRRTSVATGHGLPELPLCAASPVTERSMLTFLQSIRTSDERE